jgi:Fe-S cluster biogenesis protein NfuA
MVSRERVQSVLDRIRPLMQADGGDIELVDVSGNNASVRLTGLCSGCPSAHLTLHMGVEVALREEIQEFEELQVVGA